MICKSSISSRPSCGSGPTKFNPTNGVGRVLIEVQSALQPNRVLADEAACLRIIVPMPLIVQPRLIVMMTGPQATQLLLTHQHFPESPNLRNQQWYILSSMRNKILIRDGGAT